MLRTSVSCCLHFPAAHARMAVCAACSLCAAACFGAIMLEHAIPATSAFRLAGNLPQQVVAGVEHQYLWLYLLLSVLICAFG